MPPPTLHVLQGSLVRIVTALDHFPQVAVLCLDDLVSARALMREITRSTHLLAGHRFHQALYPSTRLGPNEREVIGRSLRVPLSNMLLRSCSVSVWGARFRQ